MNQTLRQKSIKRTLPLPSLKPLRESKPAPEFQPPQALRCVGAEAGEWSANGTPASSVALLVARQKVCLFPLRRGRAGPPVKPCWMDDSGVERVELVRRQVGLQFLFQ